ncbi:MAG: LacI family DNA-binding transcriptional regulator [Candidatus Caldatribacterium sp.]|nr:LacI family DNA-binding transcriptional regulator [Candidatus Caldatribacterium sp.]
MASIRDVAKLAGVSISTVSRVINRRGKTSKETEERVWKAVEALQYRPNLLARSLRNQKTKLLGLLVPDIDSPFFARLAKYVEEAAYQKGYNLILCNVGEDPKKERNYLEVLIQRQVEGIIFPRVSDESLLFRIPHLSKIPYVVLDRTLEGEEAPTVKLDNVAAGVLAATHLLELGHRQFACIAGPQKISVSRERLGGFLGKLAQAGIPPENVCVVEGDFKIEGGRRAMEKILDLLSPPFALFCMNDMMAFGAIQVARERGWRVPEDVSVVGLDNNPLCEVFSPPLTTVAQPFDRIAKLGISLLCKLIEGKKVRKRFVTVSPYLVVRRSTVPLKEQQTG